MINISTMEHEDSGISSKQMSKESFDAALEGLRYSIRSIKYYVIANPSVRPSLARAKSATTAHGLTNDLRESVAKRIKTVVKIRKHNICSARYFSRLDDFISQFAEKAAARAVPGIPATIVGQPQLRQFLSRANQMLEEPLRQAARTMNPTKSISADCPIHESFTAIINSSMNGKPSEEIIKAYAKAIRNHRFNVRSRNNATLVKR